MNVAFKIPTDEQLNKIKDQQLLEPGIYDFEVINAVPEISKSNNHMIKLTLKVWGKDGNTHAIFDYLVNMPSMWWKIRHFADSVGLESDFIAEDCRSLTGKTDIIIQKGKPNLSGDLYPDKNSVKDYIKNTNPLKNRFKDEVNTNDDLPEWMK